MDIWEVNKLALVIAFVIPGFLSLKTYALFGLQAPRDSTQQLIDAIAYSSINYALLLWPILEVEAANWIHTYPSSYFGFYAFVILVAPVMWALIWRGFRSTQILQRFLPHPTDKPWDYVFRKRLPYWIIATLKDGRQVAGRFGSESFATAAPSSEQLYLEEAWVLNDVGGFERPRIDTAGILVLGSEVATVELFHIQQGTENGHESTANHTYKKGLATQPNETARK